tara:strand:+ start:298 stop:1008 length:711 start_codon:yes stop_codon:yes gene_type:complete
MSENKKELIAELTKRITQFDDWAVDYGSVDIDRIVAGTQMVRISIGNAQTTVLSQKISDVNADDVESALTMLKTTISMLSKACKDNNIASPTPKGGGSSLPAEVSSARNSAKSHIIEALLPAFTEVFPVLGHYARVAAGEGGMSYTESGKTPRDLLTRYVNNWVNPQTEGAFRIHAKGYSTEELSDADFLKENNLFNKAYLAVDSNGEFDTQVIGDITVLNYARTMSNPKKKGGNS